MTDRDHRAINTARYSQPSPTSFQALREVCPGLLENGQFLIPFCQLTLQTGGNTLKRLADALDVTGDYLLEGAATEAAKARFEDRELLRQFQKVEQLPDEDKEVIKKLLDAFLTKKHIQALAK
ncbi:TPA: hypothetical protein OT171_004964 [Citrobacter sedlakii]|nr:hypothetical protein [Citrobacter sedlakii]